jgi:hypothetical protein
MRIPQEIMVAQTLSAFPELKEFSDQLYFIDATINERKAFLTRDTIEIVNEITEAYKQGRTKFLFYMFTEAVLQPIIFKIHRIAELFRGAIPSTDFIYLSGAINGEEAYENIATRLDFPFRISVLSAAMFHYYLLNRIQHNAVDCNRNIKANIKPKKFLCFNKLEREQRLVLIERMLEKSYVDLGYYSFESSHSENFSEIAKMLREDHYPNIKKHQDRFPLRLNITESRINPVDVISEDLEYFDNSYFSIVNETLFYGFDSSNERVLHHQLNAEYSSVFISEKTFKCLAVKHPFIVFGRPGTIKGLKQLGFKTFSPFFNESYDDIINDDERFEVIFNEIDRLINLSNDEWLVLLENIKPILEHNHQVFFNKTRFGVTDDVGKLFHEGSNQGSILAKVLQNENLELMPIVSDVDWTIQNITLSSGIKIQFPTHLDGGGTMMVDDLITAIKLSGKHVYERGCEWCAGYGVLGYEVLGLGLAKHMVFTDYYPAVITNCLETANNNHLSKYVTGHISSTIGGIPNTEKWDLVVSNPPHVADRDYFISTMPEESQYLDNTCRLTVDQNFAIHREFFRNIKEKLTSDADIFLIEASNHNFFVEWADEGGLRLVDKFPVSFLPHGYIFHFKLK